MRTPVSFLFRRVPSTQNSTWHKLGSRSISGRYGWTGFPNSAAFWAEPPGWGWAGVGEGERGSPPRPRRRSCGRAPTTPCLLGWCLWRPRCRCCGPCTRRTATGAWGQRSAPLYPGRWPLPSCGRGSWQGHVSHQLPPMPPWVATAASADTRAAPRLAVPPLMISVVTQLSHSDSTARSSIFFLCFAFNTQAVNWKLPPGPWECVSFQLLSTCLSPHFTRHKIHPLWAQDHGLLSWPQHMIKNPCTSEDRLQAPLSSSHQCSHLLSFPHRAHRAPVTWPPTVSITHWAKCAIPLRPLHSLSGPSSPHSWPHLTAEASPSHPINTAPSQDLLLESLLYFSKAFMTIWNYLFIYIYFFFFICGGFCHTLKWNSHGFTSVPHPDPWNDLFYFSNVYVLIHHPEPWGFPGGASGKELICQCRRHKRLGFNPWMGKIPWRRAWQPTPVFLLGECHGQRSLVGYSP